MCTQRMGRIERDPVHDGPRYFKDNAIMHQPHPSHVMTVPVVCASETGPQHLKKSSYIYEKGTEN